MIDSIKQETIRVLLVEDDEEDYIIARDLLADAPYNTFILEWSQNYDDGLKEIGKCKYDAYLIDYRLGSHDGLDLIKKALNSGCNAPLILLTGEQNREIDMQAMRGGAADYLVKGELQSTLLERSIRYAIERNRHNEVERQKDEFISIASHELKTPVTSMKAYAQLLEKKVQKLDNQEVLELSNKIVSQTDRLTHLMEYLLDVSNAYHGKIQLNKTDVDLNKVINHAVDEVQQVTSRHKIIVKGQVPYNIDADKERITQVLVNFLTNAVKYSPDADNVDVSVETKDNYVIVSVRDYGMGISDNDKKHLFERFFRSSNAIEKNIPGIGLGLYISTQIVKLHGGKMWIESSLGDGSCFYFSLPIHNKAK